MCLSGYTFNMECTTQWYTSMVTMDRWGQTGVRESAEESCWHGLRAEGPDICREAVAQGCRNLDSKDWRREGTRQRSTWSKRLSTKMEGYTVRPGLTRAGHAKNFYLMRQRQRNNKIEPIRDQKKSTNIQVSVSRQSSHNKYSKIEITNNFMA